MRGSLIFLSVTLMIGCDAAPTEAPREPVVSLATFLDQDLRDLQDAPKAQLNSLVKTKLPAEYHEERICWGPEPWFVWRNVFSVDQKRFILFQARLMRAIPDDSGVIVHFFDESERLVGSTWVATGWRVNPRTARLHFEPNVNGYVIDVESEGVIGPDIHRQVYTMIGDRLALVRLENSEGALISNDYTLANPALGPALPERGADEWEAALNSPQPAEVLEALVWLGGKHRDPATKETYVQENLKSASLVAEVRKRPSVRNLVRAMSQNRQGWVKEAAEFALKEMGK